MTFNIKKKAESKCETCSYSLRIKDGDGLITNNYCTAGYEGKINIPLIVKECNRYDFKYDSPPHEMRTTGWIMEVNKTREFMGFRPPKKRKDED